MSWSLINEFGLEYSTLATPLSDSKLAYPVFAERLDDGTYLVVDELDREKPLGEHLSCRTFHISPNGQVLFDSSTKGIPDGFGCAVDEQCLAILSRARWDISIFSKDYAVVGRIPLWTFSKRIPRTLFYTKNHTFLVTLISRLGEYDMLEVDLQGRLLWYLPRNALRLGHPIAMEVLETGNILCVDPSSHVSVELQRDGTPTWFWGQSGNPGCDSKRLSLPWSARQLTGGRRLIADTRNHRILLIGAEAEATISEVQSPDVPFWEPMYATLTNHKTWLVCDTCNRRVVEFDDSGNTVWQYGNLLTENRLLSFPRSVEIDEHGRMVIADTANNRVIVVAQGKVVDWPMPSGVELFWPRCARRTPDGSVVIADGRHSRIVEISATGDLVHQLDGINLGGKSFPDDPHDVRLLSNGHLLIADAATDKVVEVDWLGNVAWVIGESSVELSDPHSAQQLADGRVLISDSGKSRLLIVDPHSGDAVSFHDFLHGSSCHRLRSPKYAELASDGTLIIVDTGNNCVLSVDNGMRINWIFAGLAESPLSSLNYPRWAQAINGNEVLVSDHFNQRILHVRYVSDERGAQGCS